MIIGKKSCMDSKFLKERFSETNKFCNFPFTSRTMNMPEVILAGGDPLMPDTQGSHEVLKRGGGQHTRTHVLRQRSAREDWGRANVWCANFYTSPDSFIVMIDFLARQKMHHCLVCWFQTVALMARIHPSPKATLQRGYSLAVGVCRLWLWRR